VRWQNSIHVCVGFQLSNGTHDDGVLLPFLFSKYIGTLFMRLLILDLGAK